MIAKLKNDYFQNNLLFITIFVPFLALKWSFLALKWSFLALKQASVLESLSFFNSFLIVNYCQFLMVIQKYIVLLGSK